MEANTFSCLVRYPKTGRIGGTSASRCIAVGSIVFGHEPEVGMVFSQAHANPALKFRMLNHLKTDRGSFCDVINKSLAKDPHKERRQVGFLCFEGVCDAYTGAENASYAGHLLGNGAGT